MLRFRGSKRHTIFQNYERFYFLLWCVPSPCSCPLSNSTSYSTTTLVSVGAVLQQLTKTITISVRWIVDYIPFILLYMDSFTENHKRLTIMTFLVVCDNLIRTSLLHFFILNILNEKFNHTLIIFSSFKILRTINLSLT